MTPGTEQRFVFGEVADLYDRARPGYPEPLLDQAVEFAGESPQVLEAGAGTGQATVALARRGLSVTALEPTAAMAALAARNCAAFPDVSVQVATFEGWDASGRRFDLVLAAQSWHWLQPATRVTRAHQLLPTGGALALLNNTAVWDEAVGASELKEVYRRLAPELLAGSVFPWEATSPAWGESVDQLAASGLFEPPAEAAFRWSRAYSTVALLDLLLTHSDHRLLAEERRWELLSGVAELVDARGGSLDLAYEARLCLARAR